MKSSHSLSAVLGAALLAFAAVSCAPPFVAPNTRKADTALRVSDSTELAGRGFGTVLPPIFDSENPQNELLYRVTLTRSAPNRQIVEEDLSLPFTIAGLNAGTWEWQVDAYSNDPNLPWFTGSGTVQIVDGQVNELAAELSPVLGSGSGAVDLGFFWDIGQVDEVRVGWGTDRNNTGLEPSLAWWRDDPSSVPPDHNNETVLPDYLELEYVEDDGGGYGSLSLSSLPQAVASGQYTLKIMLMKDGLAVAIPSVNVVVFANLTSSDTLFLDQSMFSAAPEAPEQAGASSTLTYNLGAQGIGELEIVLTWNDTSLVDDGVEIERKFDHEQDFAPLAAIVDPADLPFHDWELSMTWIESDPFGIGTPSFYAGYPITYRIRSFNSFGASDWVEIQTGLPPLPDNLVGFENAGTYDLDPYYEYYFGWSPIYGADNLRLAAYPEFYGQDPYAPDPLYEAEYTGSSTILELNGHTVPAETYLGASTNFYYTVLAAENAYGTTIAFLDQHFRIWPEWYVVFDQYTYPSHFADPPEFPALDPDPDTRSGSMTEPLASIQAALSRMPSTGGTIYLGGTPHIFPFVFFEGDFAIDKPVTIIGGYNSDFSVQDPVNNPSAIAILLDGGPEANHTITVADGGSLTLSGVDLLQGDTTADGPLYNILVESGGALFADYVYFGSQGTSPESSLVHVAGDAQVTISNSTFSMGGEPSTYTAAEYFAISASDGYQGIFDISNSAFVGASLDIASGTYSAVSVPAGLNADLTLYGNTFQSFQTGGAVESLPILDLESSSGQILVHNNAIERGSDSGNQDYTIVRLQTGTGTVRVLDNTFLSTADLTGISTGLHVAGGVSATIVVHGNKVYMDGTRGGGGFATQGIVTMGPADISSNIVYLSVVNEGGAATELTVLDIGGPNSRVFNNTLLLNNELGGETRFINISSDPGTAKIDNNIFKQDYGSANSYVLANDLSATAPASYSANLFDGEYSWLYFDSGGGVSDLQSLNATGFARFNTGGYAGFSLQNYATIADSDWNMSTSEISGYIISGGSPSGLEVTPSDINGIQRTLPLSIGAYELPDQYSTFLYGAVSVFALDGNNSLYDSHSDVSASTPLGSLANAASDRSGASGSGVEISPSLQLQIASSPIYDYSFGKTIAFWMSEPDGDGFILGQRDGAQPSTWHLELATDGSQEFRYYFANTERGTFPSSSIAFNQNGWAHFALVFSADNTAFAFYVDGELELELTGLSDDLATANPVQLGYSGTQIGAGFALDDLFFFDRPLTEEEIAYLATN